MYFGIWLANITPCKKTNYIMKKGGAWLISENNGMIIYLR